MKILLLGATGATGRLLLAELLGRGHDVVAPVRSAARIPSDLKKYPGLKITEKGVLELTNQELDNLLKGCSAVASCLGHNITFKGMFGKPRYLVRDAAKRVCARLLSREPDDQSAAVKYVLMNTTGNRNKDLDEKIGFAHRIVVLLLRHLLPPHRDNEKAAEYLRSVIGQNNPQIEWAAVRPDGLFDEETPSETEIHPSPVRDPIFDAGKTSRINVAHFMADLIDKDQTWTTWKGRMPVIYNKEK